MKLAASKQTISPTHVAELKLGTDPLDRFAGDFGRSHSDLQWDSSDAFLPPCDLVHSFLRECTQRRTSANTKRLHHFIVSYGFQSYSFWADRLLRLLALFGTLQQTVQVFQRVLHPTLHSCHAVMAAHIAHGECEKALSVYSSMLQASMDPDRVTYLHVLQACSSGGPSMSGMLFHDQVIRKSFDQDTSVVNTLIDMYAKRAYIDEARRVFDQLCNRTVVTWGAMIGGYARNRRCDQVFKLVKQMQEKKIKLNSIIISCILTACDNPGALEQGRSVHILAIMGGRELELVVGRALINMYINCDSLGDARLVFEQMDHIDLKSWGILTTGYSQCGLGVAAFQLYTKLQKQGLRPDGVILLCMLEACQSTGSSMEGNFVHQQIIRGRFETHTPIGNALIDLHVMRGSLEDAHNVFDRMETKDIISWAALISGYVQHDLNCIALELFSSMQQRGLEADEIMYLWTLKACGKLKCIGQGISLHTDILNKGFDADVSIVGSLLDMYSSCGKLEEALLIFEKVPLATISMWGAMTSGFVLHGQDDLALEFFKKMRKQDFEPDVALSLSLLKVCNRTGAIDEGFLLHKYLKAHWAELTTKDAIAVIEMYSKCGLLMEAHELFESLQVKDFLCWSALIVAYLENNCIYAAFACFEQMLQGGLHADRALLLYLCKACGQARAMEWGNLVHEWLLEAGFDSCAVMGSALIDMYAKCECLKEAENVFNNLPNPDIVCWGSLLTGFMTCGYSLVVLDRFNKMLDTGIEPDRAIFLSVLKACGIAGCLEQGRVLHLHIVDNDLEQDSFVINALVDMYGKFGSFDEGQSLLVVKPGCSSELQYGAIISGYVKHGYGIVPLQLFDAMQERGIKAGKATFLCTLKACSNIGAIDNGRYIHNQVVSNSLDADLVVGNSLIDMYSKCGSLNEAYKVFKRLPDRDIVSWSAMISAYAAHGNWKTVIELLKSMENNGIQPDDPLFVSILSACSQNGFLHEGCQQLGQMEGEYLLSPRIDHYNCMVNNFGRGGNVDEAVDMLKIMPLSPNLVSFLSLLSGRRIYGNKGFRRQSGNENIEGDLDISANYTQLSQFCADTGHSAVHGEFGRTQGVSRAWLETENRVHEFVIENSYGQYGDLYAKLQASSCLKDETCLPFAEKS